MSRILIFSLCVLLCSGCAVSKSSSDLVGKMAPYTRVTMLDGTTVPTEDFQGKTVVLTFWASWCRRSPKVLEKLNHLARQYKNRDDLVFVTVSVDKQEDFEKAKERIEWSKLDTMQHAFSGNEVYDEAYMAYQEDSLPAVFLINPQGVIVFRSSGADEVEEYLAAH